jgi:hypothetical protein
VDCPSAVNRASHQQTPVASPLPEIPRSPDQDRAGTSPAARISCPLFAPFGNQTDDRPFVCREYIMPGQLDQRNSELASPQAALCAPNKALKLSLNLTPALVNSDPKLPIPLRAARACQPRISRFTARAARSPQLNTFAKNAKTLGHGQISLDQGSLNLSPASPSRGPAVPRLLDFASADHYTGLVAMQPFEPRNSSDEPLGLPASQSPP